MIKKVCNNAFILLLLIATCGLPITRHYSGSSTMAFSVCAIPKYLDNHCIIHETVPRFSKVHNDFESFIHSELLLDFGTMGTSLYVNTSGTLQFSHILLLNDQLKNFSFQADHSPTPFGNFRC
jgi:hypothetical protein